MKYIIVAYDKNRLIGGNNTLLWQGEMAADMRHFREITAGKVVIMGRKTYEAIGRPLPNRQNIVITNQTINDSNIMVAHSIEDAYGKAEIGKDIYIIGGGQIYEQTLSSADVILATEIDAEFHGDVYFPVLSNEWHEVSRESFRSDEYNIYNYAFVTYTKLK